MTRRPLNLLLADDSPSDLLLIEMALDSTGLPYELQTALDGLEVMEAVNLGTRGVAEAVEQVLAEIGKDGPAAPERA